MLNNPNNSSDEDEMNGFMNSMNGYHTIENHQPPQEIIVNSNPNIANISNNEKKSLYFYISLILYVSLIMNFSLFMIFLILKVDEDINWTSSKLAINFYLGMLSLMLLGNILILQNSKSFNNCLGECFLFFCLNSSLVLCMIFAILLSLKLEGSINWKYNAIFIPLYMIMSVLFLFSCFIFPGLIDSSVKMYKEAIVLLSQYFSILLTLILVMFKMDQNIKLHYYEIFSLEEIMLLFHALLYFKFKDDGESRYIRIENILMVLCFLIGFICLGLKCDEIIEEKWKFVMIPFYFIFVTIIIKSVRFFRIMYKINIP